MKKFLATADLHMTDADYFEIVSILKQNVEENQADALLIAGDVCESDVSFLNPFQQLETIGVPVVFCLGNHEFAYRSVKQTLKAYSKMKKISKCKNVYCVDLNSVTLFDTYHLFGNVLWYDGSGSQRTDAESFIKTISRNWLDCTIKSFNPKEECQICKEDIIQDFKDVPPSEHSILLTHTCPHFDLNEFNHTKAYDWTNIYSGVNNLFDELDVHPEIAVCGHTHVPAELQVGPTQCINVGNDYFFNTHTIAFTLFEL